VGRDPPPWPLYNLEGIKNLLAGAQILDIPEHLLLTKIFRK
jgi:hypothetical protein